MNPRSTKSNQQTSKSSSTNEDSVNKQSRKNKSTKGAKNHHKTDWLKWPLAVLVISFCLSLAFGVLSEVSLSGANVIISVIVILAFVMISILSDMIGVAITACDMKPFRAMASKKVRGAKEAISLKKNADRVASVFADIIGDVCGILSGAAGATITTAIVSQTMSNFMSILIASLVSAIIAGIVIFGKSLMKKYSMVHAESIVMVIAKFISFFHINKDKKKAKNAKKSDKEKLDKSKETISKTDLSDAQSQDFAVQETASVEVDSVNANLEEISCTSIEKRID